jgi:hypothetical protein
MEPAPLNVAQLKERWVADGLLNAAAQREALAIGGASSGTGCRAGSVEPRAGLLLCMECAGQCCASHAA